MARVLSMRSAAAAACLLSWAGIAVPALAAPEGTKITRVFQGPCADSVCRAGTDDLLSEGGVARDTVQVQLASSSSVGLDWVRLDIRYGSGDWSCAKKWTAGGEGNFDARFDWDTRAWPDACSSPDGAALTRNGSYSFRVVAAERMTGDTQVSSARSLVVDNRPSTPKWKATPSVSGAEEYRPIVTLRWDPVSEPDVVEYHFVRLNPGGGEVELAVSAARPGGQGCEQDGATYVCYDDYFPQRGFGGNYSYTLIAYRSGAPSDGTCTLPPQARCIQSLRSGVRSVKIVEPTPTPTAAAKAPTARPSASKAARVLAERRSNWRDFYTGTYQKNLPYSGRMVVVPTGTPDRRAVAAGAPVAGELAGSDPDSRRRMLLSVAAGLVMMLAAAHMALAMRRTRADR